MDSEIKDKINEMLERLSKIEDKLGITYFSTPLGGYKEGYTVIGSCCHVKTGSGVEYCRRKTVKGSNFCYDHRVKCEHRPHGTFPCQGTVIAGTVYCSNHTRKADK